MSLLKHWRFVLSTAVALAVLTGFIACGGDDNEGAGSPTKTGAAASGVPTDLAPDSAQVFKWNIRAEPSSIDPQAQSYTYEANVVKNIYATLLDQNPETSELIPYAAAEVPTKENGGISADGLTYTIKLKAGLKWSDGSPLTAQDYVYGVIRGYNLNVSGTGYGGFITKIKGAEEALALDPKSATYVADVENLLKDSVTAVDNKTIKILITTPSVSFASNLTLPITAAVSKANVEALGDTFGQAAGASKMVTSGPFTVTAWTPKDHLTMTRNENFTIEHKAYLREVQAFFLEDDNQAYNAFNSGQMDSVAVPPAVYPGVANDSRVQQELEFGTRWITVDVTLDPWKNKDFVIGINQATDREAIARDVYKGTRTAWAAPCAAAVVACDPAIFKNLEFNLTKAKASIAKAYPNGNIPEVTLEVVDDPTVHSLATTLQQQWDQVGVKVKIVTTDQKTLRADMREHRSGTQVTGWGMDYADATDLWSIKTTSQLGSNNFGYYSRTGYDDLVAKQDTEYDTAKRTALLKQIQEFYAADPADITFTINNRTRIFNEKIKGVVLSPFDYEMIGDHRLVEVYMAK